MCAPEAPKRRSDAYHLSTPFSQKTHPPRPSFFARLKGRKLSSPQPAPRPRFAASYPAQTNDLAWKVWEEEGGKRLAAHRETQLRAGGWPESLHYCPVPKAGYLVEHFLGDPERDVFRHLLAVIDKDTRNVTKSVGAVAAALKLPYGTAHHILRRLVRKQALQVFEYGDQTKRSTIWHVPTHSEILAAMRDAEKIGKTHTDEAPRPPLMWHNNRRNSRKILSPADVEKWQIPKHFPKRPSSSPQHAPPGEAQAEMQKAAPAPPALVSQPRPPKAAPPVVPADQQARINQLCARVTGSSFKLDEEGRVVIHDPREIDQAKWMLAAAQAHAAERTFKFPPEAIADLCERFFERARKRVTVDVWNDARRAYEKHPEWMWNEKLVEQPSPWLLGCCTKDGDKVHVFLDNLERKSNKAREKLREQMRAQLKLQQKHPDNPEIAAFVAQLKSQDAQLFWQVQVAVDAELRVP